MKVTRIGHLSSEYVASFAGKEGQIASRMLTQYQPDSADTKIVIPFTIGNSTNTRQLPMPIPFTTHVLSEQLQAPVYITVVPQYHLLYLFHNQFFLVTTPFVDDETETESVLTIKKMVYSATERLKKLSQEVEALEMIATAAVHKRPPISDAVKLLVWTRDEGRCVQCGATNRLHFDHVIPVSKGGGNSAENLQILCEECNLRKADKIAY